jgi:short-subunit dehydrogenase
MSTIAVFGAGPGLSRSVARRYGREGYEVVLVSRTAEKLEAFADELSGEGITAHAVPADLSDPAVVPELATRIREVAGDVDVIYYAPVSAVTFVPAAELTADDIVASTALLVETFAALVAEFLPHMRATRAGAILTAQGATALAGIPDMSGPGPAMAAQRNWLQALGKELAPAGVVVGRLYISALIENSAIHQGLTAAGKKLPGAALVDPDALADRLFEVHRKGRPAELSAPRGSRWWFPLTGTKPVRRLMKKVGSR